MANLVHVECPVCHEELEVSLTIINDSEGDGPYMHHFTAIDDYTIDWDGHEDCRFSLEDVHVNTIDDELDATIIQAGLNLIEAGDDHDIDPY